MLNQFLSNANWLAIIVAAVAYFALGSLWFSVLFGKQWMTLNNIPEPTPQMREQMKSMMLMMMVKTLAMAVILAFVIGILSVGLSIHRCVPGIKLGLALSAVGVIPLVMADMYLMKPLKLWFIDAGYHVVGITLMSIIIAIWH
jgi:sterol desaturase/sphingolipid hydroxylase (fatty acid hydroxylase superfamily)